MNPKRLGWRTGTSAVLITLVASVTSVGSPAHAQSWLPDREYTEGPGIRAGNLEIHPGIAIRAGYDTNVFRADGESHTELVNGQLRDMSQPEQGSAILAVTPHIHLSTLGRQRQTGGEDRTSDQALAPKIAFRGGLAATYYHYFIEDGPKNLEIDTALSLGIMPQRPVNVDVDIAYKRSVRPFTQNANDRNAYNLNTINPRVRLNFASRSQVLKGYIGYAPRASIFESEIFNYLNNVAHVIELGSSWRFLPNTALIYDGNLQFQDYFEDRPETTRSPVLFADGRRFQSRLGLNGAITRSLSLRALAGYAMVKFPNDGFASLLDDHEDVVAEVALRWSFASDTGAIELGYLRDLQVSSMGGWVRLDRGSAKVQALLGRMFMLTVEGGAAKVNYGSMWGINPLTEMPIPLGFNRTTKREDIRIGGGVHGELRVTNWFSILADVTVDAVITDFEYSILFADRDVPDPANYLAVMAFGGIRVHY